MTKYTSHNLYKAYEDPRSGWQVARIRFQEEMRDDASLGFFVRSYMDKFNNEEKTFNIFDGCPNTGVRFAVGGAAMQHVSHPMLSENAMDGYYNKETAVAIWKELVSAGFSDCFSTVCHEVDEKYRKGA
tara:strand:+ start:323 stop:709 length:387 start_codon:yes stop_codon:yes gene_type:complete